MDKLYGVYKILPDSKVIWVGIYFAPNVNEDNDDRYRVFIGRGSDFPETFSLEQISLMLKSEGKEDLLARLLIAFDKAEKHKESEEQSEDPDGSVVLILRVKKKDWEALQTFLEQPEVLGKD